MDLNFPRGDKGAISCQTPRALDELECFVDPLSPAYRCARYGPCDAHIRALRSPRAARQSLALHLHELIHRHHVVIEMSHDHHGAKDDQTGHKHPKGQREKIIRLIGRT